MSVHFSQERMKRALDAHDAWWAGALDRPLMKVTLTDAYAGERAPAVPFLSQASCANFSYTPHELIERIDCELSKYEFLGDAFPMVNFDSFGPGVLAAMFGAVLDNSSGRVWFFPQEKKELRDIHIKNDPDNIWSSRIKAIYMAGIMLSYLSNFVCSCVRF